MECPKCGNSNVVSETKRFILSNCHVLANENKAEIGDSIYQPGPHDGGTADDEIAKLSDFVPIEFNGGSPIPPPPSDCPIANFTIKTLNLIARVFGRKTRLQAVVPKSTAVNTVDCALAWPEDEDVLDSILEIGEPSGEIEAEIGMKIRKSGRTTGLNHSEIALVDATANVMYGSGEAIFEDQLVTTTPMAQGGDSGSAVLTEDNKVVGLLFAGSDTIAILNKFTNVKAALFLD